MQLLPAGPVCTSDEQNYNIFFPHFHYKSPTPMTEPQRHLPLFCQPSPHRSHHFHQGKQSELRAALIRFRVMPAPLKLVITQVSMISRFMIDIAQSRCGSTAARTRLYMRRATRPHYSNTRASAAVTGADRRHWHHAHARPIT